MNRNKAAVIALNVVSAMALLIAATWFSYNVFSSRDAEPARSSVDITIR